MNLLRTLIQTQANQRGIIFSVLIFLLGAFLRTVYLNRSLGGGDENQYLIDYGQASFYYITHTYSLGGHHVFYTILMRFLIIMFGDENAIAIRFPSYIAGLLTLWLTYQIASHLFHSKFISQLSLLLIAICPIHIYYSQIARGYSLIIFFSAVMLLASLQYFKETQNFKKWAACILVSGVLSVYTIPTNIYFLFSLGCWTLFVLLKRGKNSLKIWPPKTILLARFFWVFTLIGGLSLVVYWPLLNKLIVEAQNYHLPMTSHMSGFKVLKLLWKILTLQFEGLLILFLPFILLGLFSDKLVEREYRSLPLFILFLPLLIPLTTGLGGYARNFLFSLPLLLIFSAAGIQQTILWIAKWLPFKTTTISRGILLVSFTLIAIYLILFQTPPHMNLTDGKQYKEMIQSNSKPEDLIVIDSTKNYLYAQNVFKDNLNRIIMNNKLGKIKIITHEFSFLRKLILFDGFGSFKPFAEIPKEVFHSMVNLNGNRKLFSIGQTIATVLLREDFETKGEWITIKGKGQGIIEKNIFFSGKEALQMNTGPIEYWAILSKLNKGFFLDSNHWIVLTWVNLFQADDPWGIMKPSIILRNLDNNKYETLKMGEINLGVQTVFKKTTGSMKWQGFASMGMVLRGNYTFNLVLAIPPKKSYMIDGLRLFLIPSPKNLP